ncbi:MAG: GTP 3',8-cyclase MoaA [Proteobacteria bacterium]|nr:GTP 3',8-cyclase MoaA [Pseudomonadota bacterium]
MSEGHRVIPILASSFERRKAARPDPSVFLKGQPLGPVHDKLGRPITDLRISVIDQCNLRCGYCMPREVFTKDYQFLPREALLSFEEIEQLVKAFIPLGIRKLRITGGEPLLRRSVEDLIARLAQLKTPQNQPLEIALTTNGLLLEHKASALKAAGLQRVTVSLDALDTQLFRELAGVDTGEPKQVLAGIAAARSLGLETKVNMVVQKGVNDHQILPMAKAFRDMGDTLRFIEFMDVGNANQWRLDQVVSAAEILHRLESEFEFAPVDRAKKHDVAERFIYKDRPVEFGVIASITRPFCLDCSRARISSEGLLYTCLFADNGTDLRAVLRSSSTQDDLTAIVAEIWGRREDRYSDLRQSMTKEARPDRSKVEMSYIGG